MPKINLTNKPFDEQVRIVKDYLIRRTQHQEQGEIKIEQLVSKFKHKGLNNNKQKTFHFEKILDSIKREENSSEKFTMYKKKGRKLIFPA